MALLRLSEEESLKESIAKWFTQNRRSRFITATLHALLWPSIAAIVLAALMLLAPADGALIPSAVLMIAAVCLLFNSSWKLSKC
jgi:uncharacterized membrane protein YesL